MRNFKRIIALILVLMMSLSLIACGNATNETVTPVEPAESEPTTEPQPDPAAESGKVLNIWGWNTEFQGLFEKYFVEAGLLPDDVEVKFTIVPSDDNAYQNALDEALQNQENVSNNEKIDLFLIEADYALKYVDSPYTLNIIKDVGLTASDIAGQYKYTQDIVTDSAGSIKGTSWQATPGLFAYRRSIAKEVLGTDDPAQVQEALSTWDKFYKVAEQAHAKGYKMLSGYDDSYRTFSNNVSTPWVDADNNIIIDDNIVKWIEQTKEFTDKGYNNKSSLWDDQWAADQGPGGKVFGFFYSTWGINFTLLGNALETPLPEGVTATSNPVAFKEATEGNGIFGDYGVVEGPQNYYWGGSWLCAAAGSDNLDLVQEIMRTMTCDKDTLTTITKDTQDFTNNIEAMESLAADDNFASAFLGGQNHIKLFVESATGIDMSNISPYDQGLNEEIQTAFRDYFNGTVDYETALNNFHTAAIEKYPDLNRPD
ncbi:ABC transporter substrate-binding protein [Tissierella sp. Yu-01]|uniref:ABC transporter substrate-binding protein n=1 Tax=Tissierella sp. Yu-01 TaxID=3035694 RepID=UPI00240DBE06|nr:ABC transporter substrate-binding protein [Tissierella sp. Yu-01]WFA10026.1 ABC transporter substrate-binding protein [Tissierella sp. Yu-01]